MTVDERLALLERGQRIWRALAVAALAVALAALATVLRERVNGRRLSVSALELVDASGKTVASLAAESAGPLLRMYSAEANAYLAIGAFPGNIGLIVFDDKQPRIHLALGKNGFPALSMSDQDGRTRLLTGLEADPKAAPFLQLRDDGGRVRIYAQVAREPVMLLRDESGNPVFSAPLQPNP
jgi:hypothetical protein